MRGGFGLLRKWMLAAAALTVLSMSSPWTAASVAIAEGSTDEGAFPAGMQTSVMPGSSGSTFIALVKVIFYLIIIIGIFLLIMKILAKKKWSWNGGRSNFKTLGGLPLGQNKSVQIVEIGKSLYVLGIGENISLIQKIDEPEEIAYILAGLAPQSAADGGGWQMLGKWLPLSKKRSIEADEQTDELTASSFQQVFHSKMKNMESRKSIIEQLMRQDDSESRKVDP
jgi:flagellar protein FliO/FliZ